MSSENTSTQTSLRTDPDNVSSTTNLASELKPTGDSAAKVKPCCVCKDEKAARDECMLFSSSDDAAKECQSLVDQYRSCMAGHGFKI